ncbi:MAG TPA: FG-GAP repeat protein [Planctomycetota bacterium]
MLSFVAFALAQDLQWRLEGVGGVMRRGISIHRLGDTNGDGWEDLIEWGETTSPGGVRRNAFFVTSGQDGSVMSMSPPTAVSSETPMFFSLTAAGDMNLDGVPDYAFAMYDGAIPATTQRVEVHSGSTHALLWTATIPNAWSYWYGWSIGAGDHMDLDGDGRPDLVAGATQMSPNGTVIVYDNYGTERYRLTDPVWGVLVGVDLAPLGGDLDGDGRDDFLSAGPDYLNRGAVVVFSGQTGAVLRVSPGVMSGDKLSFATGCGDMDGDGVLDYAGGGFWGLSVVTAFSGATGLPIHTWRAPAWPYMGCNVFGGFDLDQDGVNDLVAGSDQGAVHALSGRDGSFLWTYPGSLNPSLSGIGLFQTMLAPPPGESYPMFVYAESEWRSILNPGINNILPGLLWAYRGSPRGVRTYGAPDSAGFGLPRIGMRDPPGQTVRVSLSNAAPTTPAILVLGASNVNHGGLTLPAPLDPFGLPGMTLLTSAEALGLYLTGATGMDRGHAAADLNLPPGRTLGITGSQLFAQWLWFDPLNLAIGGSTAGQRFFVQ